MLARENISLDFLLVQVYDLQEMRKPRPQR
jgi:hypothetical protein